MDIKNVKEISKWPLNPNWHEPLFIKISTVVTTIIAVIIERVGGVLGRGSIAVVKFHVRIRWCVQISSAAHFRDAFLRFRCWNDSNRSKRSRIRNGRVSKFDACTRARVCVCVVLNRGL